MKFFYPRFSVVMLSGILVACGDYDDDHYHGDTYDYEDLALYEFHMIDTYGTNSEFDTTTHLSLSPFINAGQFEVFWQANSDSDYFVELRVNDIPSTDGSRLISSELCGPYDYCHDHQYQFCDYSSGFDIRCESSGGFVQSEYIGDLIHTVPQDLYFILQVCDTGFYYCEYETRTVSME